MSTNEDLRRLAEAARGYCERDETEDGIEITPEMVDVVIDEMWGFPLSDFDREDWRDAVIAAFHGVFSVRLNSEELQAFRKAATPEVVLALLDEIDRLRGALDKAMISGNHLACLIEPDHPPYTANHDTAMAFYRKHYASWKYEAWCCWKAIMEARDTLNGDGK